MSDLAALLLLIPFGGIVALPSVCNACAWLIARRRSVRAARVVEPDASGRGPGRLLFLVPAHDEEALIGRCLDSLRRQRRPRDRITIVVVADHCRDRTAAAARAAGVRVLERRAGPPGKHHAIGWALDRLDLRAHAAVVLIDADTLVDPDFARVMARHAPLENALVQSYDGMSNEFENWLTRLAGVLTRNRWGLVLRWKEAAGLNCPLTGDGSLIGTAVLRRFPWRIETITEGWELYARSTLAGLSIRYEPDARIYAQEARSLAQSRSQRLRWTAGRFAVLRRFVRQIATARGVPLLQRLDLVAELSSPGPVMRAFLGLTGIGVALAAEPRGAPALIAAFATALVEPAALSVASLARHPEPARTAAAFLRLPLYAAWRVVVGAGAFFTSGVEGWTRTARHREPVDRTATPP